MSYIINAPEKAYCGVSAGVAFANGKGKTDKEQAVEWLKEKGYTVETVGKAKKETVITPKVEKADKDETEKE